MAELGTLQMLRDDADHLAAGGHGRVGDRPHQADAAAAIDQTDVALGQFPAKLFGNVDETFGSALRRAAIDANRFNDLAHSPPKGPSPWPFFHVHLTGASYRRNRGYGQGCGGVETGPQRPAWPWRWR